MPPHELTSITRESGAAHDGPHADHLGDTGRGTRLRVRWGGDRFEFVQLSPCEAPAHDGDACGLLDGRGPGHSREMRDLPHG
ncbi:hypothetical protein [Streptomyces griseoluteus]|uniref:hypothetical protein n=1 Tax=Streptomyces griseoluteus TaxID=29306 RepID=UPI0036BCD6FA